MYAKEVAIVRWLRTRNIMLKLTSLVQLEKSLDKDNSCTNEKYINPPKGANHFAISSGK